MIVLISAFCFLNLYGIAAAHFETDIYGAAEEESYNDFITETGAVIDQLEQMDPGFYRLEKDFQRDINDPMQFSYNGISHYSSTVKPVILSFLSKLGFNQTYYWTRYGRGSTVFADSLLGIKYLLSKDESISKPYSKKFTENGITVFENPFALPVGFAAGKSLVLGADIYSDNLFEIQNNIFQSLTGDTGRDLFYATAAPLISYQNITVESGEDETVYKKTDQASDSFIIWQIDIRDTDPLYCYLPTPDRKNDDTAEIYVNGHLIGRYLSIDRYGILPLGKFATGETITVKLKMLQPSLVLGNGLFYHENLEVLAGLAKDLRPGAADLKKISSSHLSGTVTVDSGDSYLFFSIPYEDDWTIRIDGNRTRPIRVFDALLAVKISPGNHSVDLRYVPGGFLFGAGLSLLSLILLLIWWKRNKKQTIPEE